MATEAAIRLINAALLDELTAEAQASPRGRKNRNFHAGDAHPSQRLLNAVEPGSYIRPHRHLDALKDETFIVLRGRLGLVLFDHTGRATAALTLGAAGDALGADVPAGTWHSVLALEAGTVFFESKAGPYRPHAPEELAPWAPAEGDAAASLYLKTLAILFG
jgi:cupin fold WbuC family metalloprotein